MLTASEQATLNFYQWEYQYRGYYHFDTPVDIELPYTPFYHQTQSTIIDDGRVPSIFKRIEGLFLTSIKEENKEEKRILQPTLVSVNDIPKRVGFSLSFPKGQEIVPQRNIEFLNLLSFTEHSISYEIHGTKDKICIQIVCSPLDEGRIRSHLMAYFPNIIVKEIEIGDFGFTSEQDVAIVDFGVNDEFIRPIVRSDSFSIDPLTSVIATMESLQNDDIVVLQILFKGITSPLKKDISYSVSDGAGGSFFADAPEMPTCAKEKIAYPLFSVVMRIATQGKSDLRSQYLAQELTRNISSVSTSEYNKLIPLSNEGYSYDFHHYNLHNRLSNRLGFILNSKELNTFVHYPNKTVISNKLGFGNAKTKLPPQEALNQKYILGINEHNGNETSVTLNDEARLRHIHIIGSTGVGKSTLIANMMVEDMEKGNGCALFDPHGDIVEDILLRIPEHRKQDVILIDPYDTEFPIGFNILKAVTDAEKIVLSSDIVSAFKRFATSWGDNMSSVLSQAVNTFLESNSGGTLIELKRFLLEDNFRKEFLKTVDDPSIHYYWEHEYGYVKKRISPLLTRIDTFLRPKIIRYMLAQKGSLDFRKCIDEKKIVLIKLSQGLIGEDNSYLLGSLFLSKFNQVAQGRQNLPKHKRHPYYIYCDEFQNFITPSISQMLSGARKYGLGVILAHQEIAQIDDYKTLNSVVSNPYIRICFRLGDIDAKKLESGFSYFEQSDLQELAIGQAIVRVGSSNNDFNLSTFPLSKTNENALIIKDFIIENTRNNYAQPKDTLDELLIQLLPKQTYIKKEVTKEKLLKNINTKARDTNFSVIPPQPEAPEKELDIQKQSYLEQEEEKETIRKHRSIQDYIKTLASTRGFVTKIEHEIETGERIDVLLTKNNITIAFEVSVTNSIDYEVKNIQKCIDAQYRYICMVSESTIHLKNIKKRTKENISKDTFKKVRFLSPSDITTFLDSFEKKQPTKRVRGYRVKSNYTNIQGNIAKDKGSTLKNILLKSLKKDSKKKE